MVGEETLGGVQVAKKGIINVNYGNIDMNAAINFYVSRTLRGKCDAQEFTDRERGLEPRPRADLSNGKLEFYP